MTGYSPWGCRVRHNWAHSTFTEEPYWTSLSHFLFPNTVKFSVSHSAASHVYLFLCLLHVPGPSWTPLEVSFMKRVNSRPYSASWPGKHQVSILRINIEMQKHRNKWVLLWQPFLSVSKVPIECCVLYKKEAFLPTPFYIPHNYSHSELQGKLYFPMKKIQNPIKSALIARYVWMGHCSVVNWLQILRLMIADRHGTRSSFLFSLHPNFWNKNKKNK